MPETPADAAANARRVDADAPWLGLLAFTEETQRFFFGRDAEIREIFLRVRDHTLTVLYGQSGYGKTSLLSAGLIPKLRADCFRPALLRLRFGKNDPPLVEQVRAALASACSDESINGVDLLARWRDATLWECFHHPARCAPRLESAVPVLIFDQFEEIFTLGATQRPRTELEALEIELADLVENRPPASVQTRLADDLDLAANLDFAPSPLRLIITLREDYLSHFEAWKGAMPSLMRNRMALQLLRGPQALEAVVRPGRLEGRNLVSDEVGAQIVRVIARRVPATPLEEIEAVPPLLSLLCDELNRARGNTPAFTAELVEQQHGNILQAFYARCFEGFPPEVRRFVEDRLVTVGGHRNLVAREDAEAELSHAGIPSAKAVVDALLARRLLSGEERGGTQRIEVTHDVLAPLVTESRDRRQERERVEKAEADQLKAQQEALRIAEEKRRLRRFAIAAGIAASLSVLGLLAGIAGWWQAQAERQKAELAQYGAEKQAFTAKKAQFESNVASLKLQVVARQSYHSVFKGVYQGAGQLNENERKSFLHTVMPALSDLVEQFGTNPGEIIQIAAETCELAKILISPAGGKSNDDGYQSKVIEGVTLAFTAASQSAEDFGKIPGDDKMPGEAYDKAFQEMQDRASQDAKRYFDLASLVASLYRELGSEGEPLEFAYQRTPDELAEMYEKSRDSSVLLLHCRSLEMQADYLLHEGGSTETLQAFGDGVGRAITWCAVFADNQELSTRVTTLKILQEELARQAETTFATTTSIVGHWTAKLEEPGSAGLEAKTFYMRDGTYSSSVVIKTADQQFEVELEGRWQVIKGMLLDEITKCDPPLYPVGHKSRDTILNLEKNSFSLLDEKGVKVLYVREPEN